MLCASVVVGAASWAAAATCLAAEPSPSALIILEARDEASRIVSHARATIDGNRYVEKLDGSAVPVSPGSHRVLFEAPGFRQGESNFVAAEGQKLRVLIFLISAPHETVGTSSAQRDEAPGSRRLGRQSIVAFALAGAGALGLAAGTTWSFEAKSTYDGAIANQCGGDPNNCSRQGIADGKAAQRQSDFATIAFAAGAALLAAGAILYFTDSKRTGVAVAPGADSGGSIFLAGSW